MQLNQDAMRNQAVRYSGQHDGRMMRMVGIHLIHSNIDLLVPFDLQVPVNSSIVQQVITYPVFYKHLSILF